MDARKKAILKEKFIAHAPVCPVVCGYVQFSKLRKGFAAVTLNEIFRVAQAASYMSTTIEAYCELDEFIAEVKKWKEVDMLAETTLVMIESLIDTCQTCQYEVVIFDNTPETLLQAPPVEAPNPKG